MSTITKIDDTSMTSEWRYEYRPGEKYPDLGIYTILAPNPDAGKEGVVYSGKEIALADTDDEEVAAAIVREHNAHRKLVDALNLFLAMDNCNYELETMRRSGLFEQVKEALTTAETGRNEHEQRGDGEG